MIEEILCPICQSKGKQHSESAYIEMGVYVGDTDDTKRGDIDFDDWVDTYKCPSCDILFWVEKEKDPVAEKEHYEVDHIMVCYDCQKIYSGPLVSKCPVCRGEHTLTGDKGPIMDLFKRTVYGGEPAPWEERHADRSPEKKI